MVEFGSIVVPCVKYGLSDMAIFYEGLLGLTIEWFPQGAYSRVGNFVLSFIENEREIEASRVEISFILGDKAFRIASQYAADKKIETSLFRSGEAIRLSDPSGNIVNLHLYRIIH